MSSRSSKTSFAASKSVCEIIPLVWLSNPAGASEGPVWPCTTSENDKTYAADDKVTESTAARGCRIRALLELRRSCAASPAAREVQPEQKSSGVGATLRSCARRIKRQFRL